MVTFTSGTGGGKTLGSVNAQINRPVQVTVDLTGIAVLGSVAEGDGRGCALGWGEPVLHRC